MLLSHPSPVLVPSSEESDDEEGRRLIRRFEEDFSPVVDLHLFFVRRSEGGLSSSLLLRSPSSPSSPLSPLFVVLLLSLGLTS